SPGAQGCASGDRACALCSILSRGVTETDTPAGRRLSNLKNSSCIRVLRCRGRVHPLLCLNTYVRMIRLGQAYTYNTYNDTVIRPRPSNHTYVRIHSRYGFVPLPAL